MEISKPISESAEICGMCAVAGYEHVYGRTDGHADLRGIKAAVVGRLVAAARANGYSNSGLVQ